MVNALIILIAASLLAGLLFFEYHGNQTWKLATKTTLSCLFIFAAVVQPHSSSGYFFILLIGLIFCLGGDVFLALPRHGMFLCGLVSFLLGHVFYAGCFYYTADVSALIWIGACISLAVSVGVFIRLRPYLDHMLAPVAAYIAVITVMLVGAWNLFWDAGLAMSGRLLVLSGAAAFYVSDLFVARDRFLKKEFVNRLCGLPLYYAGQFLLAFSAGALK